MQVCSLVCPNMSLQGPTFLHMADDRAGQISVCVAEVPVTASLHALANCRK